MTDFTFKTVRPPTTLDDPFACAAVFTLGGAIIGSTFAVIGTGPGVVLGAIAGATQCGFGEMLMDNLRPTNSLLGELPLPPTPAPTQLAQAEQAPKAPSRS